MSTDEDLIRWEFHNDGETLRVYVDECDDDELCNLFNGLRENTTVKQVWIGTKDGGPDLVLEIKPSLALAAAISQHSTINMLSFFRIDHMSNFGAMIVAIQQNKSLIELSIYSCDLSHEQMAELEWLLAENGLESLSIASCFPENNDLCIAQGLRSNTSLKYLTIENVEVDHDEEVVWSVSAETIEAIPHLLRKNKVIKSIDLKHITLPSEFMTQIAEAAVGHESLSELTLREIGEAGATALPNLIDANSAVTTMDLSFNNLSDVEALAMSSALKANTNLEVIYLMYNEIGIRGATAIADALRSNVGLKYIDFHCNPIGDDGAIAFAQALTNNTTLTHLSISHFGERGFNSFASCLPFMNVLKELSLYDVKGISKQGVEAFLKGLERNTELESTTLMIMEDDPETEAICNELMPKIELQMTLNRAGKRILKSESLVPDSLWPLILARTSKAPDALYFFLREKPDVLINKASPVRASRKRKRGWFSSWF